MCSHLRLPVVQTGLDIFAQSESPYNFHINNRIKQRSHPWARVISLLGKYQATSTAPSSRESYTPGVPRTYAMLGITRVNMRSRDRISCSPRCYRQIGLLTNRLLATRMSVSSCVRTVGWHVPSMRRTL